jgi:hypothetical protein
MRLDRPPLAGQRDLGGGIDQPPPLPAVDRHLTLVPRPLRLCQPDLAGHPTAATSALGGLQIRALDTAGDRLAPHPGRRQGPYGASAHRRQLPHVPGHAMLGQRVGADRPWGPRPLPRGRPSLAHPVADRRGMNPDPQHEGFIAAPQRRQRRAALKATPRLQAVPQDILDTGEPCPLDGRTVDLRPSIVSRPLHTTREV